MARSVDEIKNLRFIIEYLGLCRHTTTLYYSKVLIEKPISGIYIVPSADNVREWHGVIFPHQGFYVSGVFKFVLSFPLQYPEKPPQIIFCTPIFHPLVDPLTMELNLRAKFQTWNPSIQCEDPKCPSRDVLLYLKNVLYETSYWDNRTYCFHKNAYNAYIQWKRHLELQKHDQNTTMLLSSEEFPRYVKQCVDESIQAMYRPVKTYDRFAVNFDDAKRTSEVQVFEVIKNFKVNFLKKFYLFFFNDWCNIKQ
ncbi:ubiquitin-conjugating enzyme domain-containing protein [Reticulomyxa filosa]|uniref:Ubiquitin-conjugating enzyme domain-containing protein n=1 Tax=Reticulomyxa filosa TaxID=46433 RepID=X6NVJ6_RETFI|nr:ubiquitin-conjugating enzyme domain-containing protein [Reticulomyxa filosa]|eukprot:ETO30335.1 ubiquitin-conjugating enzyme domain-containing protein [Reticulomyxa filosa]